MAHHVCPRSNARLIEEVTRSKDRTTHDTRYEGYETRPRERNWSERTSFVRLRFFVSRESHFHAFIICNLIWSPALSNSPVELDKGKKKNSGTLYTIIYIYIYTRERNNACEKRFCFPPSLLFSFSSVVFDRHAVFARDEYHFRSGVFHTANASASSRGTWWTFGQSYM